MSDKGLVVITGASSGFGAATALAFARLGAGRAALAAFPGHFPQPLHPARAEMERMPEGSEAQRGGRAEARAGAGDHHQPLVAHSEVTSTESGSSRLPSALDR